MVEGVSCSLRPFRHFYFSFITYFAFLFGCIFRVLPLTSFKLVSRMNILISKFPRFLTLTYRSMLKIQKIQSSICKPTGVWIQWKGLIPYKVTNMVQIPIGRVNHSQFQTMHWERLLPLEDTCGKPKTQKLEFATEFNTIILKIPCIPSGLIFLPVLLFLPHSLFQPSFSVNTSKSQKRFLRSEHV